MSKKTKLDYFDGKNLLPENTFRIGASSFSNLVNRPWVWYKQQILGLDLFTQNTSTVIGSIVHYCAECKAQNKEPDLTEIKQYIQNQSIYEDVDIAIVEANWKPMAMELVNSYVLPTLKQYTSVEEFITYDLGSNIHIGGSVDAIQNTDTVVDYKTINSATKPSSIPPGYKQQLLVYAWVLIQHKRPIERIKLVYVNRPIDTRRISEKTGKSIGKYTPPTVTTLTEIITEEDIKWIESMIYLARDKLLATEQQPKLRNLIWHAPEEYFLG